MKRILSFVLILVMVLGLLAGCGAKPVEPTAGASVEDAKTYLYAMYKEDNGTIARRDYKMVSVVMIDGVSFPIEWTTDSADYVTIGAPENNMVTVDIVEDPTEQVTFKLIATLKDAAGNTDYSSGNCQYYYQCFHLLLFTDYSCDIISSISDDLIGRRRNPRRRDPDSVTSTSSSSRIPPKS